MERDGEDMGDGEVGLVYADGKKWTWIMETLPGRSAGDGETQAQGHGNMKNWPKQERPEHKLHTEEGWIAGRGRRGTQKKAKGIRPREGRREPRTRRAERIQKSAGLQVPNKMDDDKLRFCQGNRYRSGESAADEEAQRRYITCHNYYKLTGRQDGLSDK